MLYPALLSPSILIRLITHLVALNLDKDREKESKSAS